jgi:hypothetical protein
MLVQTKTLQCCDCEIDYAFTVREQRFFESKGFKNTPKRCPLCAFRLSRQESNGRPVSFRVSAFV